jgi:putative oxidoreductase
MTSLEKWAPSVLSIVRIVAALLFLEHGLQKFIGFPAAGPAELSTMLWVQGAIEVVGGILLLVGAYTRPVAFILSGDMAVAYFMAHSPRGFFPLLNGGELAIVYCFVFLYFWLAGGGEWSLDRLRAPASASALSPSRA